MVSPGGRRDVGVAMPQGQGGFSGLEWSLSESLSTCCRSPGSRRSRSREVWEAFEGDAVLAWTHGHHKKPRRPVRSVASPAWQAHRRALRGSKYAWAKTPLDAGRQPQWGLAASEAKKAWKALTPEQRRRLRDQTTAIRHGRS